MAMIRGIGSGIKLLTSSEAALFRSGESVSFLRQFQSFSLCCFWVFRLKIRFFYWLGHLVVKFRIVWLSICWVTSRMGGSVTKERILYVMLVHGWSRREIGALCRRTPCMDAELVRILFGFIIMEYREKKVLILQEIELLCHNLMNNFF